MGILYDTIKQNNKDNSFEPAKKTKSLYDITKELSSAKPAEIEKQPTTIFDWLGFQPEDEQRAKDLKKSFVKNPLESFKQAGTSFFETVKQSFSQAKERYGDYYTTMHKPSTTAEKVAAGTKVVTGDIGVLFSPVSGAFEAAKQIPALNEASTLINIPFAITGRIGNFAADKFVDSLPISEEDKETLRPAFGEAGSLAGQILLGGKAIEAISKGVKLNKESVKKIKEEVKAIEPEAQKSINKKEVEYISSDVKKFLIDKKKETLKLIEAPKEKYVLEEGFKMTEKPSLDKINLSKRIINYNEAITKFNKKPTTKNLENVRNTKNNILEIDILQSEKVKKISISKTKPIETTSKLQSTNIETTKPQVISSQNQVIPTPTIKIKSIEPTKKISGIAKSVETKSVESGLINKGYDQLAGYEASTIKEQAKIGSQYNIEQNIEFATGKKPLPQGMKPATAYSIAEDYAMETKNGKLAAELANSPIATQISESASAVSLSRMRTQDSATAKIRELAKVRKQAASKKTKGVSEAKAKSDMKKEIKEKIAKNGKLDWDMLVEKITC